MMSSVEKGPGAAEPKQGPDQKQGPKQGPDQKPEPEPEVLAMDEPRKPNARIYLLIAAIFVAASLVLAGNWGYLSEIIKEDQKAPDISPIMTRSNGYGQKVKFTVSDDINLPMKVQIRVHFWSTNDSSVNKTKWHIDLAEDTEASPGNTITKTLPYLPHKTDGWSESLDVGWYVWVYVTDHSGKKATAERCVFPTEWDADY
jgi:hypothetical protein